MKALIILVLIGILWSMGQALFSMSSGGGDPKKMVQALTIRIALSVALFALLMFGWYFGLITPHAVSH